MKKQIEPTELTPSEREEMIRLKARIEYLEAENAVIKLHAALHFCTTMNENEVQ